MTAALLSRSLDSLTELEREQTESCTSPSPPLWTVNMQAAHFKPLPLHFTCLSGIILQRISCSMYLHYLSAQPPVFSGSPGVVSEMGESSPIDSFRLFSMTVCWNSSSPRPLAMQTSTWRGRQNTSRLTHRQGHISGEEPL